MKSIEELEARLQDLKGKRERWVNMDPEDCAAARAQLELMEWILG